jgi:hypothetical protein
MCIRNLLLAASLGAAISPSISHASPENVALNACARAFASSLAAAGSSPPSYKLKYPGNQPAGVLADYYRPDYTFYLLANDSKTGARLARATCSTDSHGAKVVLTATPLDAPTTTLEAKL